MNGINVFKAIRNDRYLEHVPVIALTASAFKSVREIIPARGFDAYIPKSIANKVSVETMEITLYGN